MDKERERLSRIEKARRQAGKADDHLAELHHECGEFDGLTTDYQGYPLAIKAQDCEDLPEPLTHAGYDLSDYAGLTSKQWALYNQVIKSIKEAFIKIFQQPSQMKEFMLYHDKKQRKLKRGEMEESEEQALYRKM